MAKQPPDPETAGESRPPMVAVSNLVVRRDSTLVLEIPYLEVRGGEVLAVIGPNGAGKSTLLHVLAFLLKPAGGTVWFDGAEVRPSEDLVRLRRRTAVVFQEPLLLDTSVRENLAAGLRLRGVPGRVVVERVAYWARQFGVEGLLARPARKLSGGEAQRVSLARAFALQPELLLLDEPFSALDAPTRLSLFEDFERVLRSSGLTTVFVTHDRTEAMRLGDRVAVMMDGRIAQVGEPETVFSNPVDERTAEFVGVENLIPGRVVAQREGLAVVDVRGGVLEAVSDAGEGQQVLACLRPEDVVVAPVPGNPLPSSARNKLPGRIQRLTSLGSQVRVVIDCGFPVVSLITRRSAEELGFEDGTPVLISFKASSIHLISRPHHG